MHKLIGKLHKLERNINNILNIQLPTIKITAITQISIHQHKITLVTKNKNKNKNKDKTITSQGVKYNVNIHITTLTPRLLTRIVLNFMISLK